MPLETEDLGALTWSALNTLEGRDAYVQNPTQAGLDDGRVWAADLKSGVAAAQESVRSGSAARALSRLVEVSNA